MDLFNVALPSESSGYFLPRIAVANFRNKLAIPTELETEKLEDGLVEMSSPKGY